MKITFTVTVELRRLEGPAAERDEMEEQIIDAIVSGDPGTFEGSDGGEYEVVRWEAEVVQ